MRTEIRLSSTSEDTPEAWVWRVWEHGRLLARGHSASEEEALQAVSEATGVKRPKTPSRPTQEA